MGYIQVVRPFIILVHLLGLGCGYYSYTLHAQSTGYPYVRNYMPREFKASAANYAAVQDERGILYVGNYRGVLEYDGTSWTLIPITNRATVRALATDSSGRVYVGAMGEMGYLAPDSLGVLRYVSLVEQLPVEAQAFQGTAEVYGTAQGAFFHLRGPHRLFYVQDQQVIACPLPDLTPQATFFMMGKALMLSDATLGLFTWTGKAFEPVAQGEQLQGHTIMSAASLGADTYLVRSFRKGFYRLELTKSKLKIVPWYSEIDELLSRGLFSHLLTLQSGNLLVSTFKEGAYELSPQGKLLRRYHEQTGIQDNIVLGAFQDRQHNLWLLLSQGITRVEVASALSHFGEDSGLKGIVFTVIRHEGRLYAATPLGIYCLKGERFELVPGLDMEVYRLHTISQTTFSEGRETRLWAHTLRGIYDVTPQGGVPIMVDRSFTQLVHDPQSPDIAYALTQRGHVEKLMFREGYWRHKPLFPEDTATYSQLLMDAKGALWMCTRTPLAGKVLVYDPYAAGVSVSPASLPPVEHLYLVGNKVRLLTDKGLYRAAPSEGYVMDSSLNARLDVPGKDLGYLLTDPKGGLWAERYWRHQRWIEKYILNEQGQYQQDTMMHVLLENQEIWGEVYVEAEGQTWLGTPEGLFCYDANIEQPMRQAIRPLVRGVKAGDALIYGGNMVDEELPSTYLPYETNSLTFYYAAPFFQQEGGTRYRCRLLGQDRMWTPWSTERKKDYTSLAPGRYTFEVEARGPGQRNPERASYSFVIAPPWYLRIWAFVLYGLVAACIIYVTIKLNTRRLYLQNEHLERLVYERTTELWEQHKEVIKKTAALKRQKETVALQRNLFEEKNQELGATLDRLKATQSQLVESEKMASLGQLTAGIAHEINNPINYVKNNVGPLKRDFEEIRSLFVRIRELRETETNLKVAIHKIHTFAEEIEADYLFEEMDLLLKGIEEGAMRTKEIVDGLKIFSRSERDSFKLVDLHLGLDSTLTLLNNRLKGRIEIEKDYADLPVVECFPGKLNQVFMNVMSNAIDAIEARAHAEGRTSQEELGTIFLHTEASRGCLAGHEDCIRISIRDNGIGMDAAQRSHVFEPFYTTKEVGEGTGLGLSISFGIIEQHNGRIEVTSEIGVGTTFCIILPLRQKGGS